MRRARSRRSTDRRSRQRPGRSWQPRVPPVVSVHPDACIGTTCSWCEVSDAPVYRATRPIGRARFTEPAERASRFRTAVGRPGTPRWGVARPGTGPTARSVACGFRAHKRRMRRRRKASANRVSDATSHRVRDVQPPAQSSVGRGDHPNGRAVTGVAGQAGRVTDATDVRALLADVAGHRAVLRRGHRSRAAGGGAGCRSGRSPDPGDPLADRIAAVGAALGTDGRVAASIAFQGFAAQVVAPLFAAVAVHGVLPEASAPPGRPGDRGREPSPRPCTGAPAVPARGCGGRATRAGSCRAAEPSGLRTLLTGVLAPVVVAVRARVPVAERVLWGNVASAVASARQLVAAGRPDAAPRAAEVARHLLATPAARGHGDVAAPRTRPTSGGPSGAARAVCSTASPAVGSAATACCAGPAANAAPPTGAHRTPPRLATKPAGGDARVLLRRPTRSVVVAAARPRPRPTLHQFRGVSPVKSTVERLSPTRVRINVEVPFDELKPDFDRAYKKIAQQVSIPGFRPGKAPARILEARLGRGVGARRGRERRDPGQVLGGRHAAPRTSTRSAARTSRSPRSPTATTSRSPPRSTSARRSRCPTSTASRSRSTTSRSTRTPVNEQLDNLRARFGTLTGVERPAATTTSC